MVDILRIGLLGCGAISQFAHLAAFARARRVHLEALCDSTEDQLAKVGARTGTRKLYSSFDEMLADANVQAVLIAAPDPFHKDLILQSLDAGKHVLVEKPLATSTADCRTIVERLKECGLKLQVGSMKRHDPGVAFARNFIEEHVGPILSATGIYRDSIFRPTMQQACLDPAITGEKSNAAHRSNFKNHKERYNFWTQGVHLFDLIRYLAGDVVGVQAQLAVQGENRAWHGLLEFKHGGRGQFELICKSCGDWWEQYTVYGETGSVDVRVNFPFYSRPAKVSAFDGRRQQWTTPLGALSNSYANQLEAFAASVLEDRPANPDAADGLAAVQLLEAVETSAREGRRVAIEA